MDPTKIDMPLVTGHRFIKRAVRPDRAFLGHAAKIHAVRCREDSSVLTCSLSIRYRLIIVLAGLLGGPYLSYQVYTHGGLSSLPIVFRFLAPLLIFLGFNCFISAACPPRVRIDFAAGRAKFMSGLWPIWCALALSDIADVRIGSVSRRNTSSGRSVTECHYVQLVLRDASQVRLIETADRAMVDRVAWILTDRTSRPLESAGAT